MFQAWSRRWLICLPFLFPSPPQEVVTLKDFTITTLKDTGNWFRKNGPRFIKAAQFTGKE